MRATGFILSLAVLTLCAPGGSYAVELSCSEVLKKAEETYRNLQSYRLVAVKSVSLSAPGASDYTETQVALAVVKPGKVRLAVKSPTLDVLLMSNGETTWTYLPSRKEYTQESMAASVAEEEVAEIGEESEVDVLTETHNLLVGRYLGLSRLVPAATLVREDRIKVAGNKVGCYVVRAQIGQHKHELWIDEGGFVVLRHKETTQMSRGGVPFVLEITATLKEVELSKAPDDSVFEFAPPPKAKQVPALNLPGERVNLTGKAAVDFTLKDTRGQKIRLSDFRGQIVLIDFWATWCLPCRKELPSIEKLSREYRDKGVVILAISDEESGTVKGFLKKNEYTLQTLLDSNRAVHKMYGVRAIPTVIVVDRQGTVAAHYVGSRSGDELIAALKVAGL